MEARGSSAAKEGRAPSVPRPSLVPQDPACPDSITSLEARRGSLYEDWLIRVYCPGSQRMYDVQAPEQRVTSSLARSRSPSTFGRSASERKKACEDWLTQKRFSQVQAISNEGQDIIAATQSILDRENYFVKEVDKYLRHRDFLELRKKEIQYKKWLECVSEPLLQKIEDKVDSQSSEEIEERKRKQLALYLNYCNKKGKVALEDYDSSEYDPLFLNTHPTYLKVSTPPLHDPLLKEVQGRFLEGGLIQQCETGRIYSAKEMNDLYKAKLPLLPLGRQNMDAAEWLKIPPGYIESEIRQRKRRRVKRSHNAGTLDFKAWADSTCPPTLWKEEMYIY
ncbi:protein FAM228B isoform X2 [Gopherus flavomarginatus]|uniref:protein FAM228B isoform X2 n=1 Tax=Gopherus flavomarginatus TaxID=286002 RepID=UPI0021CBFE78|nr:protein FAM228B isoform X2 [Gopherus flavomarginatus]